MTFFEDFKLINTSVLEKTIEGLKNNISIIFTGIIYGLINLILMGLVLNLFRGPLSLIAGIILGFVTASLISNYLYLLYNIVFYGKYNMDDFKAGFSMLRGKVYSVLIFAWIARYFLNVFGVISPVGAFQISSLAGLIILIVLNALPETIYQKEYAGMEILSYSVSFIRENILNWFIPNIILSLILYLVSGQLVSSVLTTSIGFSFSLNPLSLVRYLLGQAVFSFMMIYRGHLYNILSTSTKRKREFMSNFNED